MYEGTVPTLGVTTLGVATLGVATLAGYHSSGLLVGSCRVQGPKAAFRALILPVQRLHGEVREVTADVMSAVTLRWRRRRGGSSPTTGPKEHLTTQRWWPPSFTSQRWWPPSFTTQRRLFPYKGGSSTPKAALLLQKVWNLPGVCNFPRGVWEPPRGV